MSIADTVIELSGERRCPDGFISEYLIYSQHQESPEDFHQWVALSLLASAIGRDCWKDRGYFNIYPNLFVVLVAESATMHKSTAINMGIKILKEALSEELKFFSQKTTTEALIHFLSLVHEERGKSEGVLVVPEFSTFFGKSVADPTLLQILTDYYDCPDDRSYTTIARGVQEIKKICINMLAGSTPEWLKSSLPEEALGGGFLARLLPIYRLDTGGRSNTFPEDTFDDPSCRVAYDNCVNDLREISNLAGEFRWTPDAKITYADWAEENRRVDEGPAYLRGYYGRKGDAIIKLAMLCSANSDASMQLTKEDIMFGIGLLGENEKYMKGISSYMGQTVEGKRNQQVLGLIRKHKILTRSKLLQSISHQVRAVELNEITETLEQAGLIKVVIAGKGRKYEFVGDQIEGGKG